MTKTILYILFILSVVMNVSCDLRSGIAKQNMEKYTSSPTPTISPAVTPTPIPIAEEDIVNVDKNQQGEIVFVNGAGKKTTASCTKFNRLMINGDANVVTVKGVCQQIIVNGDKNEITAEASLAFVLNGTENSVKYSRYANGKHPSVVENRSGNIVEKTSATASAEKPVKSPVKK
jgi:hypothetical protein